jgi:hypothetical protein
LKIELYSYIAILGMAPMTEPMMDAWREKMKAWLKEMNASRERMLTMTDGLLARVNGGLPRKDRGHVFGGKSRN